MASTSDRLILASASPRRKELLTSAGFAFEVDSPSVDETPPADLREPAPIAEALAARKARAVIERRGKRPDEVVLAADSIVWLGGESLAKPADDADARRMLRLLSGAEHVVATGFHVARGDGRSKQGSAVTRVVFQKLGDREIDAYIATREPFDKAGGYAIQGRAGLFVKSIAGSYSNVVGLPLAEVVDALVSISTLRPFGLAP